MCDAEVFIKLIHLHILLITN